MEKSKWFGLENATGFATAYEFGGVRFIVVAESAAELAKVMDSLTLAHDQKYFECVEIKAARKS